MSELSIVRTAQPEDEHALMALGQLAHDDNGLYSMEEDRIKTVLQKAWTRDNVIIGVVGPIGAPVGCVVLSVEDVWYAAKPAVLELVNVVHPDHRRSNHARALIKFAKKVSDGLQIPLIMGFWSNSRTEAKIYLYKKLLEPAGYIFVHNRQLADRKPSDEPATLPVPDIIPVAAE